MFANDGDTLVSCARAWCPEQALERTGRDAFESNSGVSLRVCRMSFPKKRRKSLAFFFYLYAHMCVCECMPHATRVPRVSETQN